MTHGMTENDSLVLYKNGAWHDKGVISVEDMTIEEAATKAGFLFEVEQQPLCYPWELEDGTLEHREIPGAFANIRMDLGICLGTCKERYHVFSQRQFVDTIAALAEGKTRCDTLGTFKDGAVSFASVFLDSFGVGLNKEDETKCYANFVSSHNGMYDWRGFPSGIRQVCQNTVRFAVKAAKDGVSFKHTKGMADKIAASRDAILGFKEEAKTYGQQAEAMANKPMKTEEVFLYFQKVFEAHFGYMIESADKDDKEANRKMNRQEKVLGAWLVNYTSDKRQQFAGTQGTLWAGFNSVTQWSDWEKQIRVSEGENEQEKRVYGNTFGDSATFKKKALALALQEL